MFNRPKQLSTEVLHTNPWCSFNHDRFLLSNGQEGDYYYVETTGCAMVVPLTDEGKVILILQHRYLRDKQSIEFPCGGLHQKESALEAAGRELLEETGWRAGDFLKVGTFEGAAALAKDTTHVFIATEMTKVAESQPEATGDIEVMIRRVDELEEMIQRGEIWNGQTLATWALARDRVFKLIKI